MKKMIVSSLVIIGLGSNVGFAESIEVPNNNSSEVLESNKNGSDERLIPNSKNQTNSSQIDSPEENSPETNNDIINKQKNKIHRSKGDIWTSPKYEDEIELSLIQKAKKEMGNVVRGALKKITDLELGYLKGSYVDLDIGKPYNTFQAKEGFVKTYKSFLSIVSTNEVTAIGAGYDATDVSFPIGTEGFSSDGNLKFKVMPNQKLRIERVKNGETSPSVKLPMTVPLNSKGTFYYESAKEDREYIGVNYVPIFVDLEHISYDHPLENKMVDLSYDRLEENWQWAKGDINILDYISLEDAPKIQATPKKSSFDMPDKVPSTPEEYINTSNTMTGGNLTYTWVDQLDVNAKNDQSVRVKVIDQLDNYKYDTIITLTFKANPDKTSLQVKDTSFYQGQAYDPQDNFVKGTDVNGNTLTWNDPNLKVLGDKVDVNKPDIYKKTLVYTYSLNGETKTKSVDYLVEVKEDKSSLLTKNVSLYTGQSWESKDNFVKATDEDGKDVPWPDKRIDTNGAAVNTSVPNEYNFKYTFTGKVKKINSKTKVTIKKDQTSINAKDITYYVGDIYNPKDAFISATDKDGVSLAFHESMSGTVNSDEPINTNMPGTYDVWYGLENAAGKKIILNRKVYVKEKELLLSVPTDISFGHAALGKVKKLYWDKKSEVMISNKGNRNWELTTKLTESSNQDFSNYLKFKDQSFKEGSVLIDSGSSSKNITNELTEDEFIYVDYSNIKQVRKDKAILEWTLSPSIKGVEE